MFARLAVAFTVITLLAPSAIAQATAPVDKFYDALRKADGEAIASVLTDDAVIRLADLGFDMTAEEFVDSMDMWSELTPNLTMRVKDGEGSGGETVVKIVCYDFGTNQSMTRETSTVVDGKITANMQEELAESCEGF